jgi:peptidoglycan hydrolase-like protein with peptidoglycan-binding domain
VLLLATFCFVPVSANAQTVLCLYQGVILDKPVDWCGQNGQASVTSSGVLAADSAEAIKLLQMRLVSVGLNPGPIDGYVGPSTISAVREFQRQAGLTVDGKISDTLNEKLALATSERAKEWLAKNAPAPPDSRKATTPPTTALGASAPPTPKQTENSAATTPTSRGSKDPPIAGFVILGILLGIIALAVLGIWRGIARWRLRNHISAQLASTTDISAVEAILGGLPARQLKSVLAIRQDWYERALKSRIQGGVLSDEATAQMENYRRALKLEEVDVVGSAVLLAQQGLAGTKDAKDLSAVFAKMTDGQLRACLGERQGHFRLVVQNRVRDNLLSDEAFEEVKTYQAALCLSDNDIGDVGPVISRAQQLYRVHSGKIPELSQSPILVQTGEKLYFCCEAKLIEQRVIARHTVGGSRGVSVRVMKGVSFRVGAYRGTSVSERGPAVVSEGDFCITSERVVFSGNEKSFSINWEKLLSINVASNGVMLSSASGTSRMLAFEQIQDAEFLIAILNAVYRRQNIRAAIVAG